MRKLLAGSIAVIASVVFVTEASADNTGCAVLLCLLNPQGPMAVSECVEPVQDFIRSLATGGGVPSCSSSESANVQVSRGSRSRDRWVQWTDSGGVTRRLGY
jgi:hypothetical protein